jgi:hypothetical protein
MHALNNDTTTLPEDPAALRVLLLETLAAVSTVSAERDALSSKCDGVTAERDTLIEQNERLRHLLLKLQRRPSACWTCSASPFMPRRMSVRPTASHTRTLDGNAIISAPARPAPAARWRL